MIIIKLITSRHRVARYDRLITLSEHACVCNGRHRRGAAIVENLLFCHTWPGDARNTPPSLTQILTGGRKISSPRRTADGRPYYIYSLRLRATRAPRPRRIYIIFRTTAAGKQSVSYILIPRAAQHLVRARRRL